MEVVIREARDDIVDRLFVFVVATGRCTKKIRWIAREQLEIFNGIPGRVVTHTKKLHWPYMTTAIMIEKQVRKKANKTYSFCTSRMYVLLATLLALVCLLSLLLQDNQFAVNVTLEEGGIKEEQHAAPPTRQPVVKEPKPEKNPSKNDRKPTQASGRYANPRAPPTSQAKKSKFFVLHMGPHKTGTTSIQRALNNGLKPILQEKDHVLHGGTLQNEHPSAEALEKILRKNGCRRDMSRFWGGKAIDRLTNSEIKKVLQQPNKKLPECWKQLIQLLSQLSDYHLIISSEYFSTRSNGNGADFVWWRLVQYALQQHGGYTHIQAIATYRRLNEWLASGKYEHDRHGAISIDPMWPWMIRNKYCHPDGMDSSRFAATSVYTHALDALESIPDTWERKLVSFHAELDPHAADDDSNWEARFFCHVLSFTQHSCQLLRNRGALGGTHNARSNISWYLQYLVQEYYHRHKAKSALFGEKHDYVKQAIAYCKSLESSQQYALPMKCPSKADIKVLVNATVYLEKRAFDEWWNDIAGKVAFDVVVVEQAVWKKDGQHAYCWIDVEKTLAEQHWKDFFQNQQDR